MKRAFTLIEIIIVIAVIAIMACTLIPTLAKGFENSKQNIIATVNGNKIKVIDVDTGEVIFQGNKEDFNLDGYILVDVEINEYVILKVKVKG